MNKVIVFCIAMVMTMQLLSTHAGASDCLTSELSHAAGGMVISGVTTAVADKFWPEHRALIGFTVGAAAGVIGEGTQDLLGNGKFSLLDAVSNGLGAAIGTLITDKFILMPVVRQQSGNSFIGVVAHVTF